MKSRSLLYTAIAGLACAVTSTSVLAGTDTYPQATYECRIDTDKSKPGRRLLTVKVKNRSKHIHIYGFRVDAHYLDCKIPDPRPSKEFLKRACTQKATARMALGSMARPPRDDIHVPPGQTRSYRYRFRYPGQPRHDRHLFEHCMTYATATFTAEQAPEILGLTRPEEEELSFWQRWWQKVKSFF